jgi:signal transduction histidine kinase
MLQEMLQNTNKYANAQVVTVKIYLENQELVLVVSDDGVGFVLKKVKKGIGLQNIYFRTNECKGIVDISSIRGKGTTITVKVPI